MALPGSGQLSLSAIRDEFGAGTTSNVSLRTLSSAAGLSVPDGLNEFYGLSAYTPPSIISGNSVSSYSGAGTQSNPYLINVAYGPAYFAADYYNACFDNMCMIYEYSECIEEPYGNAYLYGQTVIDTSGTGNIRFTSNFSGQQRAVVSFAGGSINSCGSRQFSWLNVQGATSGVLSNGSAGWGTLSGQTLTTGNLNRTSGQEVRINTYVGHLYYDAIDAGCTGNPTTVYYSNGGCYYRISASNVVMRVYFEAI